MYPVLISEVRMIYLYGLSDIGFEENRGPQTVALIHVSQVKWVITYCAQKELGNSLILDKQSKYGDHQC